MIGGSEMAIGVVVGLVADWWCVQHPRKYCRQIDSDSGNDTSSLIRAYLLPSVPWHLLCLADDHTVAP